mgnify:CR=1 FL=1
MANTKKKTGLMKFAPACRIVAEPISACPATARMEVTGMGTASVTQEEGKPQRVPSDDAPPS